MAKHLVSGKRILLIEDDEDIREVLVELLESEGYAVTAASSGKMGLKCLRQSNPPPNLIFLDLVMSDMDGGEFRHEQLKLSAPFAKVPVVVLSADNGVEQKATN